MVTVDIMRKSPPALVWPEALADETVGIPGLVAMELIQGCRNRTEQTRVEAVLRRSICFTGLIRQTVSGRLTIT